MKKRLFSTVFLASTFIAPLASAQNAPVAKTVDQPLKLELGGYMTWYGAYTNQRRTTNVGSPAVAIGDYNNTDFIGDAEIYFSGSTELSNGVKIGATVELKAGTDSDSSNKTIDKSFMQVDSKIGRFIIGNNKNVSDQMAVTSPTVSTLGVQETDFRRLIMVPTGFAYNKATYAVLDSISTKVSYITPTYAGLTFGVSLMPGGKSKGQDDSVMLNGTDGDKLFKRGLDTALVYQGDFGKFDVEASALYTVYKPNIINTPAIRGKNINEYGAGLNVHVGNLNIGGSYHHANVSEDVAAYLQDKTTIANGDSWDFGVKYSFGPCAVSSNVFQSRADSMTVNGKKDVFTLYQISGEYQLMSGMNLFTDIGYADFNSASEEKSAGNKGTAVAMGVNVTF